MNETKSIASDGRLSVFNGLPPSRRTPAAGAAVAALLGPLFPFLEYTFKEKLRHGHLSKRPIVFECERFFDLLLCVNDLFCLEKYEI